MRNDKDKDRFRIGEWDVIDLPPIATKPSAPAVEWVEPDNHNPRVIRITFVGYVTEEYISRARDWMERNHRPDIAAAPMFLEGFKRMAKQIEDLKSDLKHFQQREREAYSIREQNYELKRVLRKWAGQEDISPWL